MSLDLLNELFDIGFHSRQFFLDNAAVGNRERRWHGNQLSFLPALAARSTWISSKMQGSSPEIQSKFAGQQYGVGSLQQPHKLKFGHSPSSSLSVSSSTCRRWPECFMRMLSFGSEATLEITTVARAR